MNVYLVGGAVRDELIGREINEKDWVVVGSTEEDLLAKKFKKIKNVDPLLEKKLMNLNRQFLHAKIIGFIHPKKNKEMIFSSILPQELEIILKMLRNKRK